MSELHLQMDEGEILREYSNAKNKFEQVKILAELNCVSKKEMAGWLKERGCEVDGRYFCEGVKRKPKTAEDVAAISHYDVPEPKQMPDMPEANTPRMPYTKPQVLVPELLTKDEAFAVADHIDHSLFDMIRNDTGIDSMRWLCSVVSAYRKLCEYSGYVGDTEHEEDNV